MSPGRTVAQERSPALPEVGHPIERTEPATPPAEPAVLASNPQEGGLVSFVGHAATGASSTTEITSSQVGLVCDVRFASKPDWKILGRIPGVLPAAVRSRPGFVEIAALHDGSVSQPITLDAFLASHPEFTGRWTVLLPQQWLLDMAEQLLPYKGGWQPHLLVGDSTFDNWMQDAREFATARGQALPDVARLDAVARLQYSGGQYVIRLTFQELVMKESSQ